LRTSVLKYIEYKITKTFAKNIYNSILKKFQEIIIAFSKKILRFMEERKLNEII